MKRITFLLCISTLVFITGMQVNLTVGAWESENLFAKNPNQLFSPEFSIEDYTKIAHLTGGGPSLLDSDYFGRAVAAIGDLDRDGMMDLVVGAYGDDTGGSLRGAVYVMFMNTNSTVRERVKISHFTNGGPVLADGDYFGWSVAAIGDLNRDGYPDMAIGAPGNDGDGGQNRGIIYILMMQADGIAHGTVAIGDNFNGGPVLVDNDGFGQSVASMGDLDGDGVQDLVVGASGDDTGGDTRGAIYVLFMNDNGTARARVKIAHATGGGPSLVNFDRFGFAVASPGDLDRDGLPDLLVGAYGDDTGGSARGAAYVLFMNANGTVRESVKIGNQTNGGPTLEDGDWFGYAIASPGDLNRDGITDLAVGARNDDGNGSSRGAAYILYMNADGSVRGWKKIADNLNGGPVLNDTDYFGAALAAVGDLDRDGIPDLAVGAYGDDSGGTNRGALYLLHSESELPLSTGKVRGYVKIAHNTGGGPPLDDWDYFTNITEVGDLDRDGITDLAVGADGDDTGGSNRGAVYMLLMNPNGTARSAIKIAHLLNGGPVLADGDYFGSSLAGIGDLDRDGIPDIAVGSKGDDSSGSDRGAVYVLFMRRDGTVRGYAKIAHNLNGGPVLASFDRFGSSVDDIGDLDRDGVIELTVGAPGDDTGGLDHGAVYVLFLRDDGTVRHYIMIAHQQNGGPVLEDLNYFGWSIAAIGDLDRDGITDLAVGAPYDNFFNMGKIFIAFMNDDGTVRTTLKIARLQNGGPDLDDFVNFGFSIAAIGDLDRDSIPDIAVGAPGDSYCGAFYVMFLNVDGTVQNFVKISNLTNGGPPLANGDYFGYGAGAISDLDQDGVPDLGIGSLDLSESQTRGAVYILFMDRLQPIFLPLISR